MFLARLKLAQGDVAGAAALLAAGRVSPRASSNFVHRMPEVAAAQVLTLLRQGKLAAAAHLAETHDLPLSQARVHLARETPPQPGGAASLAPAGGGKGWADERLKVMVLQAVALQAHGEHGQGGAAAL